MASISVDEMRDIISGMYKGPIWKEKVKHMSDRQVMAIYFSKSDSELRGKHKKKRNTYETKQKERVDPVVTDEGYYGEQLALDL
jgi:hypothetical protein